MRCVTANGIAIAQTAHKAQVVSVDVGADAVGTDLIPSGGGYFCH